MRFKRVKKVHFVGVGGIGMSGIAEVLLNLGYQVSGSDLTSSEVTQRLGKLGAVIHTGHQAGFVNGADAVVYSSAVKPDNPEVVAARQNKIPVIPRSEMLAELMRMKFGIAVAGTHGKTTTTSMIGEILSLAGLDPTIVVGGKVINLDTNAKLGQGIYLVAEADEFDRSFLKLTPSIAVITTLETEHLDCYQNFDEIKRAFLEFANKVPFYGNVVLCTSEQSVSDLIPEIHRPIITYGLLPQTDLEATELDFHQHQSRFKVKARGKELGQILLSVPGVHNVKNSLAAVAVGLELEISWDVIKEALENFKGVRRRFEIKGIKKEVLVVDDYAHHPSEIKATLDAAKQGWHKRVIAVFQPHLYSRTRDFYQEFGRSFANSDVLVLTDIYPAREEPIPGISAELILEAAKKTGHPAAFYYPDRKELLKFLQKTACSGDMVITLGAGDIYKVGQEFLESL